MKHNRKGILNLSMESFSLLRYHYRSKRGRFRTNGEALSNFQEKVQGGAVLGFVKTSQGL